MLGLSFRKQRAAMVVSSGLIEMGPRARSGRQAVGLRSEGTDLGRVHPPRVFSGAPVAPEFKDWLK